MTVTRNSKFLLLSIGLILIVTLMPGNGKVAGNQLDKLIHFLIFFPLGWSIRQQFSKIWIIFITLTLGIILGWATEYFQQYIPGRNYDWKDGLADNLGLLTGYFLSQFKK